MYIVTGGLATGVWNLDLTEIYNKSLESWEDGAPLPSQRYGLKATNIDDQVLIFGKIVKLAQN